MACPNCGAELADRDRFCPWCGAPQQPPPRDTGTPSPGSEGADLASRDAEIGELRAAVNAMTNELARLSLRLSDLERGGASTVSPPPQPAAPAIPPQPQAPTPAVPAASPQTVAALGQASRRPATPIAETATAQGEVGGGPPARPSGVFADWNWEWLLGGNWLARIGIVAIIFGVAFFISLAIDRGWLGEAERVILGVAGGLAFIGAGEYFRRRYGVWAQTVTGGGIAILYLSVYGAFALYGLISTELAFGAFALITLAGALLSLRHEAVGVAVLSIFGGFATPLLLREQLPDQRLLLAYVLVLDVGVLALAGFRNWRWFTLLGWAGSLILFAFWQQELEPSTGLAQIGITAIFLVFAGATIAFHIVKQQAAGIADLALVTLNAAGYYGISYWLMNDPYRDWMGGFTALVAVFYLLLAAACRMRGPEQLNLTLFSAGLAVVFAVIAVPVQLGGPWISVAWGIEALVLIGMSFPLRMRELRWAGYAMFVVSGGWLLVADTPGALAEDLTPFYNEYTISYAAAIVLPILGAYLLHLRRGHLEPGEEAVIPFMALRAAIFVAAIIPVQVDGAWIAVAWAVESVLALLLSARLRMVELRWFAYGLLVAMLVRLLWLDTLSVDSETFRPVLNWRFLAFAAGIAALYASGWLSRRNQEEADALSPVAVWENRTALPALLALANFATLWLLSAEILTSADSALFDLSRDASENVASLGLSLLWAVYAAVLISLGVIRKWRWVRLAGLALLAVPVVKLFAYDSQTLEQEYRVIAFIALGLILLAGGLLYQRYSRAVRGFLFE
ncbi:MAG: DUF2339 domain-containing protein [Chloroflexi bacterium]|nr:DUF2339 domain-containing protein [Chloroflexota bacterium]